MPRTCIEFKMHYDLIMSIESGNIGSEAVAEIESFEAALFGGQEALETAYRNILAAREGNGNLTAAEDEYEKVHGEIFSNPLGHPYVR